MSTRVRKAMALDAVEEKVLYCGEHVRQRARATEHYVNRVVFVLDRFVGELAESLDVSRDELWPTAMTMLRVELEWCLSSMSSFEVVSVEPHLKDGKCVGMEVTFRKDLWRRSA